MSFDIGPKIGIEGEAEFRKALNLINTSVKTLSTEMMATVSKFDKNEQSIESLTAKNTVLNKQIDVQKQKLAELQKGLQASAAKYGENDKVTQGWQQAVNKATADLNDMERELDDNTKAMDELGDETEKSGSKFEKFGGIVKGVGIAVGVAAAAAGAAAIKLGKEVVQQFGELEQNLGGSEAVFGKYAASIQKTGEEAYKNLGVSQSDYLATANKMGALFQGTGIEQQKSLELTEKAMQRAADMASVMGIDMQVALDSVAGAAKGNFTMMDNLGVAMNATNIEAYALSKGLDFTWKTATQAEKAEVAMQMFFENTQQYAGNFARESTQTITGSIGLLKAALGSFTAGLGNVNADMTNLTQNLVDAFQSVVANIVPILENVVTSLPTAVSAIISAVGELLPVLLSTATELFGQILETILNLLPGLIPAGLDAIMTIVDTLLNNLPLLIDAAIQMIIALAEGFVQALPELIPAIIDAVLLIADKIVDNLDLLVDAGIALIIALAAGLIEALPKIIEKVPQIINAFWEAFDRNLVKILGAGVQLIVVLGKGIIQSIPTIIANAGEIVKAIFNTIIHLNLFNAGKSIISTLGEGVKGMGGNILGIIKQIGTNMMNGLKSMDWLSLGKNIIKGIIEGITGAAGGLAQAAINAGKGALSGLANSLGIHSPSRVMRDQIGVQIPAGIGQGITDNVKAVTGASRTMTGQMLNTLKTEAQKTKTEVGEQVPAEIAEGIKTTSSKVTEAAKNMFKDTKEWIDERKYYNELSLQDELAAWQKLQEAYASGTEERKQADREVYRLKNEMQRAEFENSKKWIAKEKAYYNMSLTDELAAWQRVQKRYIEGTAERIEADENILRVKKEINEAMKSAEDDYYKKVKETKDKLIAEEKRLTEAYNKAVNDRAKAIKGFVGLFGEVNTESEVSGQKLLKNLEGQVEYMRDWRDNLDELASRGIDSDLLAELTEMGPSAGNEIAALLDLTNSELSEYEYLWRSKNEIARAQAVEELRGLKADTQDQIKQLREETEKQLEEYEKEFDRKILSIRYTTANTFSQIRTETGTTVQGMKEDANTTLTGLAEESNTKLTEMKDQSNLLMTEYTNNFINKIIEIRTNVLAIFENMKLAMPQLGVDTIAGLMQGIESMRDDLMDLARDIAESVAETMRDALDIHSPSRVFDELGKMTGLGFANGLYDSIRDINAAMDALNSEISVGGASSAGSTTNNRTTNNTNNSNIVINNHYTVRNDNDAKTIIREQKKMLNNLNRARGVVTA